MECSICGSYYHNTSDHYRDIYLEPREKACFTCVHHELGWSQEPCTTCLGNRKTVGKCSLWEDMKKQGGIENETRAR